MANGGLNSFLHHLRRIVSREAAGGLSDSQLVERFARDRDEAAFEVLVWRHGPMVQSLCRRLLRNLHDAEDASQATFLILARKASSIGKRAAVSSWLYKVAYRVALRARARTPGRTTDLTPIEDVVAPDPGSDPAGQELRQLLDEAVAQLPDRYRTVIVQHYFQGRASKELAESLGCPIGTVTARLTRGRDLLRRYVARRGVSVPAALFGAALSQAGASGAVSATLVAPTVHAAALVAAGRAAAAGTVSAQAVVLAEEVVKTMFLTKLKVATAALLLAGVLGTGTGLVSVHLLAIGASSAPQETANTNAGQQAPAEPANREPAVPVQVQTSALLERALQTVPAIEDAQMRVVMLCEIAKLQARVGLRDAAAQAVRQAIEATRTGAPGSSSAGKGTSSRTATMTSCPARRSRWFLGMGARPVARFWGSIATSTSRC